MKILLVDDDEVIRGGMKKIIAGAGRNWEVVAEAGDGELALKALLEHPDTDLMITDVRMPIMDGIELIRRIRERGDNLKIIVLSGYDEYNYVRSAFMSGAVDYLLKPFQKKELLERVDKIELSLIDDRRAAENDDINKAVLIADILQRLTNAEGEEQKQALAKLNSLGIRTELAAYVVVRVMADQYYKQFADEKQYGKQLDEDIRLITDFLTGESDCSYCYYRHEQEMILLMFADEAEKCARYAEKVHAVLSEGKAEENTGTVGISRIHTDSTEMALAFTEAEDAVLSRFYMGQGKLIPYDSIAGKCIDIHYDLEPMVSRLVHSLELCDYMQAKKVMEQIFLDLSYCRPDRFRKYMHTLIEMLVVRVRDFESILMADGQDYQFHIDYMNTYRELKTFMNSLLQEAVDFIRGEKEKKSKKRIELAKAYIEEHYKEPITLNDIADYIELNASYFSNLFKQETGMNFTEYLLNIRMEQAKKLLRDPTIKVYEIGNMVGYEDAVSFGRAFKKKFNMSPKDYRNSVY